ncbi:TIM-barrel domain-containing protein [Allocoleopsis sp.]|uniref:glycoside hydrolase family 31 protein n=1 Tax=Allocoleopsis sp. TaxID=3088169 RepID=UPI002FD5EDDE
MQYELISNCVVCNTARFSALSNGLVRLEWSASGQFEDYPTAIALTRPQPFPFKAIELTDEGVLHLHTEFLQIVYQPGHEPFNDANLTIHGTCGNKTFTWTPSTVDTENLGGTFTSLDLIHRNFHPYGVHPASVLYSYPHTEEWLYTALKSIHQSLRAGGETTRFEDPPLWYLDDFRLDEIPESMQEFLQQWHHYPPGILSRSGYSVLNDSTSALVKDGCLAERTDSNCQDWYFFGYGTDYAQALQDFVQLCDRIPMLPRWAFGVWFSLYDQMHDSDYRQLVKQFDELELPLDVVVLDVDWHLGGWCGWDWNEKFFPDAKAFLQWAHSNGLHIGANVHIEGVSPEDRNFSALCEARGLDPDAVKAGQIFPVKNPTTDWIFDSWQPDAPTLDSLADANPDEGWLLFNLASQSEADLFMQVLHSPREEDGIDFWWIDGANAKDSGVNSQLWTNHVYFTHLEAHHSQRPLILSRTGGLGSHRYPVQFSADTYSHWEVLQFLVDFTARAGNVGVSYWSNDLGGFFGHVPGVPIIDPELFVRWVQFGCFSPIVRCHSDHGRREPWSYGQWVLNAIRKALQLRMQLIPYLYHLSRVAYETGLPLCRPLYLAYPEDEEAYQVTTQFLLGDRILVAPVVESGGYRSVYLPEGQWWERSTGQCYTGRQHLNLYVPLDRIPVFVQAGAILPLAEFSRRVGTAPPTTLILEVYAGADGELDFYEDDGESTTYRTEAGSRRRFTQRREGDSYRLTAEPVQGSYSGMLEERSFRILWTGLVSGSRVEARGVEICEQEWRHDVLCLTLATLPQTAFWQILIMS